MQLIPSRPRYLTKSRFKLALECPTKLYYTGKKEYYDSKLDNDFLKALAEGGFQVGELAKLYFKGGVDIDVLNYEEALERTNRLLGEENAIIYEAAFRHENFFIRADILIKNGNGIELIEVKAKSYDQHVDSFTTKKGDISSKWSPYLYDVAFQKWVVIKAWPQFSVRARWMWEQTFQIATVD